MHQIAREADIDDLHTFVINEEGLYTRMIEETGSDGNDLQPEYGWVRKNESRIRQVYDAYVSGERPG